MDGLHKVTERTPSADFGSVHTANIRDIIEFPKDLLSVIDVPRAPRRIPWDPGACKRQTPRGALLGAKAIQTPDREIIE